MPNTKTLVRVTFLLACVTASVIAVAQGTDGASFQTQLSSDNLRIDIYRKSSLSAVLTDLCKTANVACSGLEVLANDLVPAMVVEGKFLTIVRQLAEGANVNIEYAHGTPQSGPKLTLLRPARVATAPAQQTPVAGDDAERSVESATVDPSDNPGSEEAVSPGFSMVPLTA